MIPLVSRYSQEDHRHIVPRQTLKEVLSAYVGKKSISHNQFGFDLTSGSKRLSARAGSVNTAAQLVQTPGQNPRALFVRLGQERPLASQGA